MQKESNSLHSLKLVPIDTREEVVRNVYQRNSEGIHRPFLCINEEYFKAIYIYFTHTYLYTNRMYVFSSESTKNNRDWLLSCR